MTARRRRAHRAATILVVEDSDEVRELVRLALEGAGREIIVAGSGSEALAAAVGPRIDVLVTEVVLRDLSGPEVARLLRAEHPSLGVIYISGRYDQADFPDVGDGLLLPKPFSLDELRRAVARMIEGDPGRGRAR